MTDQDKSELLEDILGGDELNQLRQASLSGGLKEMRSRRQRAQELALPRPLDCGDSKNLTGANVKRCISDNGGAAPVAQADVARHRNGGTGAA